MALLDALADLVFAPVCLGCEGLIAPRDTARLVCRRCRSMLRPPPSPQCPRCGAPQRMTGMVTEMFTCAECRTWPDPLRFARSAFLLEAPADRIVHQLKYHGWHALGEPLGGLMCRVRWPDEAHEPAVVTAVPTTAKRLRSRGYNQAAMIALSYARHTRRPYEVLLCRGDSAGTQTTLQPAARAANVAGAFAPAGEIAGRHVILVDDVLTTGATASECALVLHAGGACCVRLITFARAFLIRGQTSTMGVD